MACFGRSFSGTEDLRSFYPIRPELEADVPKIRFRPRAGQTLSARRWHAAFSEDGHLDIAKVLRRIQRGGVHPSIKGVVWEFLLGCYDPNSTFDERIQIRQSRRMRYERCKAECQAMVPVIGSGRFISTPCISEDGEPIDSSVVNVTGVVSDKKALQWMLTLHQIGLDVIRTDRALVFYETEANEAKLWDVLSIYAWFDIDIGYVQGQSVYEFLSFQVYLFHPSSLYYLALSQAGMNDICSPMVILIENEADAFWCFERAMRRLRENFRTTETSMGVQSQLSTLSTIIKTIDPKLHQHLEDLDGGEYLFAFRMLMVLFRREFSFVDSMHLWELIWAMEYYPHIFAAYESSNVSEESSSKLKRKVLKQYGKFERKNVTTGRTDQHSAFSIFLVASVLETKHKRFLKEARGLDDIVAILGEITAKMDAKKACNDALKIHKKYLSKTKKQS